MSIIYNEKTIKMQLKRIEVIDLLIALDEVCVVVPTDGHPSKWQVLRDKLRQILDESDKKYEERM